MLTCYLTASVHRRVGTSMAAAEALTPTLNRPQRPVLVVIRNARFISLTVDELGALIELDRYKIEPRTTELKRNCQIVGSGR